jgi:hypothetical protein
VCKKLHSYAVAHDRSDVARPAALPRLRAEAELEERHATPEVLGRRTSVVAANPHAVAGSVKQID